MTTIVVIAKECLPGRVKTRLHPPLSLEQAAQLAAASLDDTLLAVAALPVERRVLAFDGTKAPDTAAGFDILPQTSGGLDERLAAIFDACTGPTVLIGMDTPQVTSTLLAPVVDGWNTDYSYSDDSNTDVSNTDDGVTDAWFGSAHDGGFWALGLRRPDGALIRGVPMSRDDTGARQLARLQEAGLRIRMLPSLTDVDTIADAHTVAALAPQGRFATTLRALTAANSRSAPTGVTR